MIITEDAEFSSVLQAWLGTPNKQSPLLAKISGHLGEQKRLTAEEASYHDASVIVCHI